MKYDLALPLSLKRNLVYGKKHVGNFSPWQHKPGWICSKGEEMQWMRLLQQLPV